MTKSVTELDALVLKSGGHESVSDGLCAMEAVAWLAGEPHSDRPECACPVLAAYVRNLNDRMPDAQRQRLKPYLALLIGTRTAALELARAQSLAWSAITTFAPAALEKAGLFEHARALVALTPGDWKAARKACQEARSADAYAAYAYAAADAAAAAAYAVSAAAAAYAADANAVSAAAPAASEIATAAAAGAAAYAVDAAKTSGWDMALAALDKALGVTLAANI